MTKDAHNKETDTIELELTPRERELLLNLFTFDEELEQQIRQASTIKPPALTLYELEELAESIAAEANHTKNKKRQKILDEFYKKIENLLSQYQEEEPSSND
jgi:poly-D-alanine transfer protein DltD